MFGAVRTILAFLVVAQHYFNYSPFGLLAVYCFFTLSGFLMTLLVDGPYKGRPFDFALNRFLRIYPQYWFSALIIIIYVLAFPGHSTLPSSPGSVLRQIFIVVPATEKNKIIPVIWAVSNELIFYLLIALGVSKDFMRSALWAATSAVVVIYFVEIKPDPEFYFSPLSASLPFAMGAVTYHLRDRLIFAAACAVAAPFLFILGAHQPIVMVYAASLLFCPVIMGLFAIPRRPLVAFVDEVIGRFSYPIYLSHLSAVFIVKYAMIGATWDAICYVSILLTIALSGLLVVFVDVPIQFVRSRIKNRKLRYQKVDDLVAGNLA